MEKEPKHWSEHPAYKEEDLEIKTEKQLEKAKKAAGMIGHEWAEEDVEIKNEEELEKAKEAAGVTNHEEVMGRVKNRELDGISELDKQGKANKFKKIYKNWHDTSYEKEKKVGRAVEEINIGDIMKVYLEERLDPLYGSPIPGPMVYGFFSGIDVSPDMSKRLKLKLNNGETVMVPFEVIEQCYKYEE